MCRRPFTAFKWNHIESSDEFHIYTPDPLQSLDETVQGMEFFLPWIRENILGDNRLRVLLSPINQQLIRDVLITIEDNVDESNNQEDDDNREDES